LHYLTQFSVMQELREPIVYSSFINQVFRRKKLVIRLANAGGRAGGRAGGLAGWRAGGISFEHESNADNDTDQYLALIHQMYELMFQTLGEEYCSRPVEVSANSTISVTEQLVRTFDPNRDFFLVDRYKKHSQLVKMINFMLLMQEITLDNAKGPLSYRLLDHRQRSSVRNPAKKNKPQLDKRNSKPPVGRGGPPSYQP
ncbi:hypothetical protein DPMN_110893, partial [Dreissena polymorpha]